MIPAKWTKEQIAAFMDALDQGQPLAPTNGSGWTGADMMVAAGCLFAGMHSQGASMYGPNELSPDMHPERAEAFNERLERDLERAATWLKQVAFAVCDDQYDQHFDGECAALIDEDRVVAVSGFKLDD